MSIFRIKKRSQFSDQLKLYIFTSADVVVNRIAAGKLAAVIWNLIVNIPCRKSSIPSLEIVFGKLPDNPLARQAHQQFLKPEKNFNDGTWKSYFSQYIYIFDLSYLIIICHYKFESRWLFSSLSC